MARSVFFVRHLTVKTGHEALCILLSTQGTRRKPRRNTRWAVRLLKYDYEVKHIQKRNENLLADMLSRLPAPDLSKHSQTDGRHRNNLFAPCTAFFQLIWRGKERHARDLICLWYYSAPLQVGMSNNCFQFCLDITSYEKCSPLDGLLLCGGLFVRPLLLRRKIIYLAHESHSGILRTKERSRQSAISWPKMDVEVLAHIKYCHTCQTNDKTAVAAASRLQPMPFSLRPYKQLRVKFVGSFASCLQNSGLRSVWQYAATKLS